MKAAGLLLALASLAAVAAAAATFELPPKTAATSREEEEDLVQIHESPKPIQCSGVKHNDLAPESQIVGVHFGSSSSVSSYANVSMLLNIENQKLLALKPKQNSHHKQQSQSPPGKQSQEFDIAQEQQFSNATVSPIPAVPTSEASSVNASKPEQMDSTSTTIAATTITTTIAETAATAATESQTTAAAATTTTSTSRPSSEPEIQEVTVQTTTTTTPPPVESTAVPGGPVGTKTIRHGDAIFCGEANPNGKSNKRLVLDRIVGGRKTEPGEFPFQVRLNIRSRRGSGICGGVILDSRHILTAAHCMTACASQFLVTATIENGGVHATIGDHSIKSNDGEQELEVERIIPHEKYDACNFYANDHDIALIKTSSPIEYKFTSDGYGSINRPCMPKQTELAYRDGESAIVSGWGVTRENSGSLSNILRYVQVPIVNLTRCQETYGSRVTRDHVCAGYQAGGKDSCQGDSGGPLVRVLDNRYELVGIVSFGYGCGQPGAPGVYTRVASYIDWIKANL